MRASTRQHVLADAGILPADAGIRGEAPIETQASQSAMDARSRIRAGAWTGPTVGLAPGYVQANLAVLPVELADDFEAFCRANPAALPLLERTDVGSPVPERLAPTADLRTDLPRYRLYRDGRLAEEPTDIVTLWRSDYVAFLIGCSFSFDELLAEAGIEIRHRRPGGNVPMYRTNRTTTAAGGFHGPLIVTMRPMPATAVERAERLTSALPEAHGRPIHIGDPAALGIADLSAPNYGSAVTVEFGEVPVFWACGVTAQAAATESRTPIMIAHAPGHMFITDRRVDALND